MTSESNNDELNDDVLPDDIVALLGDEATWAPVSDELEASVIAAVMAEVDAAPRRPEPVVTPAASPATAEVIALPSRWKTAALGAAAALLVGAGLFGIAQLASSGPDLEVALAGTDLAPLATANAEITETPEGTRIVIRVDDLPPAAPGTYYQAWLRKDAEVGVSAGTFHLRDGDDAPIELWAGVTTDDYPLLTVTLQQEAQTESSGQVVLKALIGDQ